MPGGPNLTADEVQRLALDDRVRPHPQKYHAHQHLIPFRRIQAALTRCFRIQQDPRPGHPDGWIAHCFWTPGTVLRVDLDLYTLDDGHLLLIVTAMELNR